MVEALVAEPHGDRQRPRAVVAKDYDMGVGVEFGMGPRSDFAHGHEQGIPEAGSLKLPWLTNVEQYGSIGGGCGRLRGTKGGKGLGRDLGIGKADWRR